MKQRAKWLETYIVWSEIMHGGCYVSVAIFECPGGTRVAAVIGVHGSTPVWGMSGAHD